MGRIVAIVAVMLALSFAIAGCVRKTLPGAPAPVPFEVAKEKNPSVIWMVREVNGPKVGVGGKSEDYWVLLACYRKPASDPGHPVCYIAKVAGTKEDLKWSERLFFGDGSSE